MKRLYRNIRARDAALQETPKILQAVRVYAAIYVLHGVVNNFVDIVSSESFVGQECVRVESRASFDMLADLRLQFMLLAIRYNCGADFPARAPRCP
jgi:hypothetical protein